MSAMPPLAPTAGPRSLIDRVKSILLQPRSEWPVIEAEPASVGSLYRYVLILAAIPAICGAVGMSMLGGGVFNFGAAWVVLAYFPEAKLEFDIHRVSTTVDIILGDRYVALPTSTEANINIANNGRATAPPGTCAGD